VTQHQAAAVVIPARRASTRLPEKLLLAESGRPLLAHTLERCLQVRSCLSDPAELGQIRVIAAVDCQELADVARAAGAEAVLTDPELASGSDRVWAVAEHHPELRFLVNVQGDEPEIEPQAIALVLEALVQGAQVATLCAPLPAEALNDPDAVKVVRTLDGMALYFSRAAVPHRRGAEPATAEDLTSADSAAPQLHIGVYGYTRGALERYAQTPPSPLEKSEALEQLRFLEHGVGIKVLQWQHAFAGIDTRSDYDSFLARLGPPMPQNPPTGLPASNTPR
jgi:3-deoxy-manno-octulosonate cytidylyltransferase (CMP-KDO synthetase)